VVYGQDPRDSILEGVLASTALPPWVTPFEKQGQLLIDGGVVSNLPIEAAMTAGATEIFALDLADYRDVLVQNERFGVFVSKLIYTVEQRQQNLELAMAAARGIPVTHLRLQGIDHVPLWDFHHTTELIVQGYQAARQEMKKQPPAPLGNWLLRWWRTRRRAAGPAS
jgi:NTE family protein